MVLQALRRGQQDARQGLEGVVQMQPATPVHVPRGLVGRFHIVEHEDARGLQVRGNAVYKRPRPAAIHGRLGTVPAARDGMRFRDLLRPAWQPRPHVAQPGLCLHRCRVSLEAPPSEGGPDGVLAWLIHGRILSIGGWLAQQRQ